MAELKIEKLNREWVNKEKEWSDKEKMFESNKVKIKQSFNRNGSWIYEKIFDYNKLKYEGLRLKLNSMH